MNFTQSLTLLFAAAKLLNLIDWSWWLVFSPIFAVVILNFIRELLADYIAKKEKEL